MPSTEATILEFMRKSNGRNPAGITKTLVERRFNTKEMEKYATKIQTALVRMIKKGKLRIKDDFCLVLPRNSK